MLCRTVIAVSMTDALAAWGLMVAGAAGNGSTGEASESVITFTVKAAVKDDQAIAISPAYVTCNTSANTNCNSFLASGTIPHDITTVDAPAGGPSSLKGSPAGTPRVHVSVSHSPPSLRSGRPPSSGRQPRRRTK